MAERDPYDVLQLTLTPDTVWDDIYAAYRRRAKETHPDLGGSQAAFLEVQQALETLLRWDAEQDAARAAAATNLSPAGSAGRVGWRQAWEQAKAEAGPVMPRVRGGWRHGHATDPYQPRRVKDESPRRAATPSLGN